METLPVVVEAPSYSDEVLDRFSDLTAATTEPDNIALGGALGENTEISKVYVVPDGYTLTVVDVEKLRTPFRAVPQRTVGTVHVDDVESFLEYWGKHANEESEIYWRDTKVIGVVNASAKDGPQHGDHRVVLELKYSPEWVRWFNLSGRLLPQDKFAEFLEDAGSNVVDPDYATMLEIAQDLRATSKLDFEAGNRPQNGQRHFKYMETIDAKAGRRGELEIPERIGLLLRVFQGQDPVNATARFRYQIGNPLQLGFTIDRVEDVVNEARDLVIELITSGIAHGSVFAGIPTPKN